MGAQQLWMWLSVTAVMTLAAIVVGAATANQMLAVLSGTLFTAVATIAGWRFAALMDGSGAAQIAARFARLISLAWAWGGASMLGAYYLTDLNWQHAWQYGLAMLLIAAGIGWYAGQRADAGSSWASDSLVRAARLATGLQAVAAIAAVGLLASSGKLQPEGRDWAANVVFIAGGLAIFSLSMAGLRAERRAMSR